MSRPTVIARRATSPTVLAVVLSIGGIGAPFALSEFPVDREPAAPTAVAVPQQARPHSQTNRIQLDVAAPSLPDGVSQPAIQGLIRDSGPRVTDRSDWPSPDTLLLGEIDDLRVFVAPKKEIEELGKRGGCRVIDLRYGHRGGWGRFWIPITGSIHVTNLLVQVPGLQDLDKKHQVRVVGTNSVTQTSVLDAYKSQFYGDLRVQSGDIVVVTMRPDY